MVHDVEHAAARSADPLESHEAARSITPRLSESQDFVLSLFREHGEMDDRELVSQAWGRLKNFSASRVRSARCELARFGKLEECGHRDYGHGRRGRVWRIPLTRGASGA